jgi:CheY-like chemotaxis protein
MSLPLFHIPGSIAFLDDDADYLQMLALVVPAQWHVKLYSRCDDCIVQLQQEPPLWEADAWAQQQMIDVWRQLGTPLVPQILRYWAEHAPSRYALTQVFVVDYSMPQMNGLQVLDELADWPGLRVLLTGQADEQIAVQAFNRGLIDQFLPKQAPDIAERLIEALARMQANAGGRFSQIWRGTLTPVQNALLRVPSIARALRNLLGDRWVEYVVIGEPFGVLGRAADGTVGWLQMEPVSGLEELEALAESIGTDQYTLADIRSGTKLIDLELGQALGREGAPLLRPAFAIDRDEALLGALFPVDAALDAKVEGYRAWLAAQSPRAVRS